MKALLTAIILLFSIGISYADRILMAEDEIQLQQKFRASPTHEEVVAAFESRHPLLHLEAIKWLILNRDLKTWNSLKDQKSKLKETSLQLYPILDFMAEHPLRQDKPLVLGLKEDYLKMLVKKDEEVPPRYEDGDPPVDEVLYELLAEDLKRMPASSETVEAAKMLHQYREPLKKPEVTVKPKVISDTVTPYPKETPNPAPPTTTEEGKKVPSATPSNPSFNPLNGWKVLVIVVACSGLVAFFSRFGRK